jgi:hypothetical protein
VLTGPARMCIGCRRVRPKRELLRLVLQGDGLVTVDARHRAPGRGAYVCADVPCVERACKGGRLAHAFRRPARVAGDVMAIVGAGPMTRARDRMEQGWGNSVVAHEVAQWCAGIETSENARRDPGGG